MIFTERRDLRGGTPCWIAADCNTIASDPLPSGEMDIAIIGAGVMGAMVADRLASAGRRVVLLDRRPPAHGATAASTALVMWAADVPLTKLAESIGENEAARRWQRVHRANRALARLIDQNGIACDRSERPELYLAGSLLDEAELQREADMRQRAGLPSRLLGADEVAARFGIAPRAALLSEGSYGVDPVKLTLELITRVRAAGGAAHFPADVVGLERGQGRTTIRLADGRSLAARTVILASGYERAHWFLPAAFSVSSSFAIATPPHSVPPWRENALIWEASSPYFYGRITPDGRVIAGGEDEDFDDDMRRDALIGHKAGRLMHQLQAMTGVRNLELDCEWSASFGSSPDGLPAIGPAAGDDGLWLASGFGGNGVTFAALGAEIVAGALMGSPDPDAECFDPYRFAAEVPDGRKPEPAIA